MTKPILSQSEIKARLHYNPETGMFTWIKGRFAGKIAGWESNGYWHFQFSELTYRAHRAAWLYMTGEWPVDEIDHINRDGLDNRFVNLRESDRFLNTQNVGIRSDNTSGHKGVRLRRGRWLVRIHHECKEVHIGFFDDLDDAIAARKQAEIDYHGN